MSVKSYNAASVTTIFYGVLVEGYMDGTFVTAARNNQAQNLTIGSDGEGCRAKSNDKSGTVTLTLMQSSASNALLTAIAKADELSGDGVGPLLVKDLSGSTLISAETAWIQKIPDVSFAREAGEGREWVFETENLDIFAGGN